MKKVDRINVVVMRFGSDPEKIEIGKDSTVEEALKEVGMTLKSTEKIWVNGEKALKKDILQDGDNVAVVSPKEAGIK
jgi:sulfur carrier protein ThiS